ncbi:IS21 family transposase [Adlercreutzia shanghongiae]|uniref:IS21 family transposase n=1 Tax=Adlercreutzia shanghongiae TaxID=3111773 RepID=A0ABU6J0A7_9ACTN|nr:IS21 family transposase [Adlercreutzia sp. R22]MEC4295551.1 IS21 family transposase [Adlercreutzia sp. R22]
MVAPSAPPARHPSNCSNRTHRNVHRGAIRNTAARQRPSILDPYKDIIEGYLDEDARNWHKQRHSAKRIHERLVQEHNAKVGYTTVQLYVKARRAERKTAKDQFLKLVWAPGEAQVDFGEADFVVYGRKQRMHYLTVDFPFSNVGLAQVFPGENAECVCQGLLNIFAFIGGVPIRLVFDNATGVGRRIGEVVRASELFGRFACHFGFEFSFCNPRSGHEKGAVENKVGATRRNLFVPVPRIYDVARYNIRLLDECMGRSDKEHYAKGESERALFMEDAVALRDMPAAEFSVVSYRPARCDKYGYVCLDGNHRYAADPSLARRSVIVGRRAFCIDIYTEDGELVATHDRAYGDAPSSSDDPLSQLNVLCMKPSGWQNSLVRHSLPDDLRSAMDAMDKSARSDALRCLRDTAEASGYASAVDAMGSCMDLLGEIDRPSVEIMAASAASGRGPITYDDPADLSAYDAVYGKAGGFHAVSE